MRRTMVVSVFAGCGKTWLTNHQNQYGYSMRDSDSSTYEKTAGWEKEYINSFMEEAKSGKYDFIFVCQTESVIDEMDRQKIPYVIVEPDNIVWNEQESKERAKERQIIKQQWFGRFILRDNSHIKNFSKWLNHMKDIYDERTGLGFIVKHNPASFFVLKQDQYAKKFYEEAYHFLEKKFGSEYVVAAVMHADEINKAATSDLGKDVYHYHLHAVVIPVVDKDILWSKRCKDPALRGTVRETIHQVSHSKKWASNIPLKDEQGQPVLRSNGKPKYRPSYSILQDELVAHMQEHGFTNFQRGELGSTRENLTSLQYQIEKDKERLANIQERVEVAQTKYEAAWDVRKTESEIDDMGKKTITGKYTVSKEDYKQLTALAKEGITSRQEIHKLNEDISLYKKQYIDCKYELRDTQSAYAALRRRCEPFLQALKYFPQFAKGFAEKIADLLEHREAQQKKEREEAKRNPHRSSVRRQDDQDLER